MSKKWMSLWREARLVKMHRGLELPSTFRKLRRPKVYVAMARSTCSQNGQSTGASKHFWEVEMSKKCLRLWREACFEVQKNWGYGALLDVQMSFRVAGARDFASCKK